MNEDENQRAVKFKMGEVREENERLRLMISQVKKGYDTLKMRLDGAVHKDNNQPSNCLLTPTASDADNDSDDQAGLVSLSLGKSVFSDDFNGEERKKRAKKITDVYDDKGNPDGLELRLQCRFYSETSTDDEIPLSRNEGSNETRNTMKNSGNGDDHEILQQNLNWKGPRVSMQKCLDKMKILSTSYEATHNYQLPPSSANMASALSTLNCSFSTSSAITSSAVATGSLNLLNLNRSSSLNNYNGLVTSQLPKISFSSSQSHPTVVLDLTTPNHYSNKNSYRNNFSSTSLFSTTMFSPQTSLDFSNSDSSSCPNHGWRANGVFHHERPTFPIRRGFWDSQKQAANDQKSDISAGTKAVMDDPSFQTALAAAITSFVGSNAEGRRKSELDFQLSFSTSTNENKN